MKCGSTTATAEGAGSGSRGDTQGESYHKRGRNGDRHGMNGHHMRFDDSVGGRQRRRQQRAGQWRSRQAYLGLRTKAEKVDAFTEASRATMRKQRPSNKDLVTYVDEEYHRTTSRPDSHLETRAREILSREERMAEIELELAKERETGGHGWISRDKQDGIIRLIFENYNSIKLFNKKNKGQKIRDIDATRRHLGADVMMGCDLAANFDKVDKDSQKYHELFGAGEERRSVAAWN